MRVAPIKCGLQSMVDRTGKTPPAGVNIVVIEPIRSPEHVDISRRAIGAVYGSALNRSAILSDIGSRLLAEIVSVVNGQVHSMASAVRNGQCGIRPQLLFNCEIPHFGVWRRLNVRRVIEILALVVCQWGVAVCRRQGDGWQARDVGAGVDLCCG